MYWLNIENLNNNTEFAADIISAWLALREHYTWLQACPLPAQQFNLGSASKYLQLGGTTGEKNGKRSDHSKDFLGDPLPNTNTTKKIPVLRCAGAWWGPGAHPSLSGIKFQAFAIVTV